MPRRNRDYRAEYARRLERGRRQGLSRSQARGHPSSREGLASQPAQGVAYDRQLEAGFKEIERGKSLTAAARDVRVSPERLRRYLTQQHVAVKQGRRWVPLPDQGVRRMLLYTGGQARTVKVNRAQASDIGTYFAAVGRFLSQNDPQILLPHVGQGVTDIHGAYHPFETRPNTLCRLAQTGAESFEQVYRIIR